MGNGMALAEAGAQGLVGRARWPPGNALLRRPEARDGTRWRPERSYRSMPTVCLCPTCGSPATERIKRRFWMRWFFGRRYKCSRCGRTFLDRKPG